VSFETLSEYTRECHQTAEDKGFHEPMEPAVLRGVQGLAAQLGAFAASLESFRKGNPYVPPGPVSVVVPSLNYDTYLSSQLETIMRLLLIASECWEAIEAVAQDPEKEPAEIADILIRVFDYAGTRRIDLDSVVGNKMQINTTRPHKHGHRF
jgi:NTP pyrophosphatase (non-canonical NTP hydrolase)